MKKEWRPGQWAGRDEETDEQRVDSERSRCQFKELKCIILSLNSQKGETKQRFILISAPVDQLALNQR